MMFARYCVMPPFCLPLRWLHCHAIFDVIDYDYRLPRLMLYAIDITFHFRHMPLMLHYADMIFAPLRFCH